METLNLKDVTGKELFVGDRCVMWRPDRLDVVELVKYNPKTNQIGIEIVRPVDGKWNRQRFSTPYLATKFYKL